MAECGLACLAMVASHYGSQIDLATMRHRHTLSGRGASLRDLIAIADQMGFSSRAIKLPLDKLANLALPAILHWDLNHYVVLERLKGRKARILDPSGSPRWLPMDVISSHFTGVALELHPSNDFRPVERHDRQRLSQLWTRMTGLKQAILQTLALSLVMQTFVILSPYYMQVAIDNIVPAGDQRLLFVLAIGFALFSIVNVLASLLRSFVLLSAGTAISYSIASNIARRLFRLPVTWFEKRHVGDVLSRFQSVSPIQIALTQGAAATIVDGALAVFTVVLMFLYSIKLGLVALVALSLYIISRAITFSIEMRAREIAIIESGREQSVLIETIRGITTLRLFNQESARHSYWQARFVDSTNANVRFQHIGLWQKASNTLVFGLEVVLSILIAISSVIVGELSLGMVFAFMAYKTQFLERMSSLVDQVMAFKMLTLHLERLADISMADEDVCFRSDDDQSRDFCGALELKGVTFRYAPGEPVVLDNVNLIVESGAHIAITGVSGGGKTTLVKIMLGLLEPDEGEVLIDGLPVARFGYRAFRSKTSAVLQEDCLFAGSLASNIALFDDICDPERVAAAAKASAIHDDILRMPMKYETPVGDMGSTLSGGQKQRILLARAIYRNPRLLIVDEGTSHLDSRHERAVNQALSNLGITRIVVAHRRETIRAAARVYELENGRLREISDQHARSYEQSQRDG